MMKRDKFKGDYIAFMNNILEKKYAKKYRKMRLTKMTVVYGLSRTTVYITRISRIKFEWFLIVPLPTWVHH